MQNYLDLMRKIRDEGTIKHDRTGVGTTSIFGSQLRFDLSNNSFPLVTTKKCHLKSIIHELLWFLQGETNIRYLKANGVSIWDSWIDPDTAEYVPMTLIERLKSIKTKDQLDTVVCWIDCFTNTVAEGEDVALTIDAVIAGAEVSEEFHLALHDLLDIHDVQRQKLIAGDLGPVYGSQWRKWEDTRVIRHDQLDAFSEHGGYELIGNLEIVGAEEPRCVVGRKIDQIADLITQLKTNPDSRRLIVSAWNPSYVEEQALPPCHSLFQFYTEPLTMNERLRVAGGLESFNLEAGLYAQDDILAILDQRGVPTRKLSCQLYQRKSNCALTA
jgi:thymidylate synthase